MILLILSLLNWIFINNKLIKVLISLVIFIVSEIMRRKGESSKSIIVAEFISALILIAYLLIIIIDLILKFK